MELRGAKELVMREVGVVEVRDLPRLMAGLARRLGDTARELADRCAVPARTLEMAIRYVAGEGVALRATDVLELADSYVSDSCDILDPLVCALAVAVDSSDREVTRRDVEELVNGTLECLDRALLPEYRDEGVEFLFPGKPLRSNVVEEEARRLVMYIRGVLDGRWSGSNVNDPIDQDEAFARLVHQ